MKSRINCNPTALARRHAWIGRFIGAALLFLLFSAARAADEPVYSFGVIPQFDSRTIHDTWGPILAQLQARTGLRFELMGAPGIPAFERSFGQQEYDFAYVNPYQAMLASSSYVPLVRNVASLLVGIIVVRKDGPIQDLRSLQIGRAHV